MVCVWLDAPGLLLKPRDQARHRAGAMEGICSSPGSLAYQDGDNGDRLSQLVGGHRASTDEGKQPREGE